MILVRQKNFGILADAGALAGKVVSGVGKGVAVGGLGVGKALHGVGNFLGAHPVGTGLLAAYGLWKLIKRRRAQNQGNY